MQIIFWWIEYVHLLTLKDRAPIRTLSEREGGGGLYLIHKSHNVKLKLYLELSQFLCHLADFERPSQAIYSYKINSCRWSTIRIRQSAELFGFWQKTPKKRNNPQIEESWIFLRITDFRIVYCGFWQYFNRWAEKFLQNIWDGPWNLRVASLLKNKKIVVPLLVSSLGW